MRVKIFFAFFLVMSLSPGLSLSQSIMTPDECVAYGESLGYEYTDSQKERLAKRIEKSNRLNEEINFYGKVLDPQGNGIPNATVGFEIDYLECWVAMGQPSEKLKSEIITDEEGFFAVTNYKGTALIVTEISADGYTWDVPRRYGYSREMNPHTLHVPDEENPEEFSAQP